MALADRNPEHLKAMANDRRSVEAEANKSAARVGLDGQPEPSDRQSEGDRGYGRQGGSIADTGTRTDDPVGVEQVESSAVYNPSAAEAREWQGDPPAASKPDPDPTN